MGSSLRIDRLFSLTAPETLTKYPAYQRIRAALPANASVTAYLNSGALTFAFEVLKSTIGFSEFLPLETLWQAALNLHPLRSAGENALLTLPPVEGIGAAAQLNEGVLDVTAALSVDAQYPAPVLPTASAGSTLLNLIPRDSFFAFASYDISVPAIGFAGVRYALTPTGNYYQAIYDNIVREIMMTPTLPIPPTSTPMPGFTVEALLEQVKPLIRQAESTLGISVDELYPLISGEYAAAVFPNEDAPDAVALYLQSSNPQRLLDALDNASRLILTNPSPVEQLMTLESRPLAGMEVTMVSAPGMDERLALGVLNNSVLFVTTESAAKRVIEAANDPTTPSPSFNLLGHFGEGQEALFYANPRQIDSYPLDETITPLLPLNLLLGALDVRENGLFVLHLAGQLDS
ncbi:MAG: DUF3352 domain-containing protein [Chloroflexota bacterium]